METNIDVAGYNTPGLNENARTATKNSLKAKIKVDRYAPIKESDIDSIEDKKHIQSPSTQSKPV